MSSRQDCFQDALPVRWAEFGFGCILFVMFNRQTLAVGLNALLIACKDPERPMGRNGLVVDVRRQKLVSRL
jgi:hypothetical protein